MRKTIEMILFCVLLFSLTGCHNIEEKNDETGLKEITGEVYQAKINDKGDIVLDKNHITENVSYYNYDYEEGTIGLLAVRDENRQIHVVINTCQSCGGSPYAYFVQMGEKIQCQNCGSTFLISELDHLVDTGCNPIGIEIQEEINGTIVIQHELIEQYKDKFINWLGPK